MPSPKAETADSDLRKIDLDRIRPNRAQPRTRFDPDRLEELAQSMKSRGVLQPVIVRAAEGGFELIAGERRWRAAQMAGLLKIPAVVRDVDDEQLLELALVENLQRADLDPIEESKAYQTLIDELGLTQQEVAERVGKPRTTVANSLRLLNLPIEVQAQIQDGGLSAGHAKALAALTETKTQIELARRIVEQGLTVRAVEALVRRPVSRARTSKTAAAETRDPNVVAAEQQLQKTLGTRVRIVQKASGSGRVEIEFYSDEELERLYEMLEGRTGRRRA